MESTSDNKRSHVLILAALLVVPCSAFASDTYTVAVVGVYTNKTAFGDDGENVRLIVDGMAIQNKDRTGNDGKDFWRIDKGKSRPIDVTLLEGRPLGTSFRLQLEAIRADRYRHIGTVKTMLQKKDGEVQLAFEMKHNERTRSLRRRQGTGDKTIWVTRIFPDDGSANYVVRFKIERARRTSSASTSHTETQHRPTNR